MAKGSKEDKKGPAWSDESKKRLEEIAKRVKYVLAEEEKAINERKEIEEELKAVEDQKGDEARELKADHYDVEAKIARMRAWKKSLLDKMVEAVDSARQGVLFDAGNDDLEEPKDDDPKQMKLPKGTSWPERMLHEDLTGPLCAKFRRAGIEHWARLAELGGGDPTKREMLNDLADITADDIKQVQTAAAKVRESLKPDKAA